MEHRAGEESPREGGLGPSEGRWVPTGSGGGQREVHRSQREVVPMDAL